MFVRIAWQARGAFSGEPKALRRLSTLARRESDDLGVPPRDFHRMTKGLFDRPE